MQTSPSVSLYQWQQTAYHKDTQKQHSIWRKYHLLVRGSGRSKFTTNTDHV